MRFEINSIIQITAGNKGPPYICQKNDQSSAFSNFSKRFSLEVSRYFKKFLMVMILRNLMCFLNVLIDLDRICRS